MSEIQYDADTLAELLARTDNINKLKQALGTNRYRTSSEPKLREISGHGHIQVGTLASKIGMNSREFELLLQEILADPDEHEIETMRKLMLVAKLKHAKATMRYQDEVEQARSRYETECKNFAEAKEKEEALQVKLTEALQEKPFLDLQTAWAELIDKFVPIIEAAGNNRENLSELNKVFYDNIDKQSKLVNNQFDETVGEKRIVADWVKIRNDLKIEHIRTLIRGWSKSMELRAEAENGGSAS